MMSVALETPLLSRATSHIELMMKSGVVSSWFVCLVTIAMATTSGDRHSSFGFVMSFFYHSRFSVIVFVVMKLSMLLLMKPMLFVVKPRVMGIMSPDLWSSPVIMGCSVNNNL